MGQDTPDWGGQYNNTNFYPLFDMGELAARLGSPVLSDRRGALIWLETFEHGLGNFVIGTTGAASAASLIASPTSHGPFAAKATVDSNANDTVSFTRTLATPLTERVGVACQVQPVSNPETIDLFLTHFDGTKQRIYGLRLDLDGDTLQVLTQAGYVTAATLVFGLSTIGYFLFAKLVADINLHRYERCIFAGTETDLSAYGPFTSNSTTTARIVPKVAFPNLNGVLTRVHYLDTVIVTANEPPNE